MQPLPDNYSFSERENYINCVHDNVCLEDLQFF